MSYVQEYSKVGIETEVGSANPHELVLMLFEGAIASIIFAQKALERDKVSKKGEAISKAIRIIGELDSSLNMEAGGEIATNLRRLYEYISLKLVEANTTNDVGKLNEVVRLLSELKVAWEGIAGEAREIFQSSEERSPEKVMSYGAV